MKVHGKASFCFHCMKEISSISNINKTNFIRNWFIYLLFLIPNSLKLVKWARLSSFHVKLGAKNHEFYPILTPQPILEIL